MKFTKDVDLATESYTRDEKNEKKNGIITTIIDICGSDAIKTEIINEIGERNTGKEIGTYLTLPLGEIYKYNDEEKERIKKAVGDSIRILINEISPKPKSFLALGLGNKTICADSLGCLVAEELVPTRHLKDNASLYNMLGYDLITLSPGVLGQSGIDACDHLSCILEKFRVDLVILVDSFMTLNEERLLKTVQISNTGIFPGSARNTNAKKICKSTIGTSVITVGVPTAISLKKPNNVLFTRSDVENHIAPLSKVISGGIMIAIKDAFSNNDALSDIE